MKYFCVSYDLVGKNRSNDYDKVDTTLIEEFNGKRILGSVWILTLTDNWNCEALMEDLKTIEGIEKKDRLLVSRIFGSFRIRNSL